MGKTTCENTNLKLYCAFVIDQTQNILHPGESLCHTGVIINNLKII